MANINKDLMQSRKRSNMAALLQYTILFCILVLGIYGVLIIRHKSFLQDVDGLKQGYFWTVELKHQMEMLFAGEGLQLWSWSKLLGMSVQTNRYWDPFNWIAAAFPVGYIELGITIATLLRLYLGGALFLALMRYTGLSVFSSVFGAAAYTFTEYNIMTGIQHPEFLMNVYLFPLLVLCVEMIYKEKSPAFFSLVTGLYLLSNFYHAYMAAITIIPYIILRYFAYKEFEIKDFAKTIGKFVCYGCIGICIGCIQFLQDYEALSWASASSATDREGLFFDGFYYVRIGQKLIGTGGNINDSTLVGWTVIVIMLLAIAIAGLRMSKTPVLMSLILLAGMMLPIVCSIYNGFGYPARRWVFVLEFFSAWAAAAELDKSKLLKRSSIKTAIVALGVTAYLSLGLNYIFDVGLNRRGVRFMAIQLIGGAAFAVLLLLIKKEGRLRRFSKSMIIVIFAGTLSLAWTQSFSENTGDFYRNNKINKMLEQSTQRAGALIDDDGFYRVDQVDSILFKHLVYTPPNETLWWQTRSIYEFNSRIPSALLEFNRLVGNNYGYSKRVAINSNDNRTGLDFLYGVKYFLGNDLKNGKTGSDEYAGYGFEDYKNLDGVNVFKSKYNVSLGYVIDKYMNVSEFEKLGYAEREQALMQSVVLPDDTDISSVRKAKKDDIQTSVKDVRYDVVETDGATLNDDSIVVDKDGGSITLKLEDVDNSQLIVSITGLLRDVSEGQSMPFELRVINEYRDEMANNKITNQTIPNIKDYNLNLGYYDHYSDGHVTIRFSSSGVYKYDDLKINAMDVRLFDDCIGTLSDRRFKIDSFSDTSIEGSVDSETGGILFLSIIEPKRWDCYIDGEKAETIESVNIAFTGVEVPKGHHDITLKYNNRMAKLGMMLSVAGLIILAAVCLYSNEASKKRTKEKEN